jgi:hypothetical protein
LLIKEQILFRLSCYSKFTIKLVINILNKASNNKIKSLNISNIICKVIISVGVTNLVF